MFSEQKIKKVFSISIGSNVAPIELGCLSWGIEAFFKLFAFLAESKGLQENLIHRPSILITILFFAISWKHALGIQTSTRRAPGVMI